MTTWWNNNIDSDNDELFNLCLIEVSIVIYRKNRTIVSFLSFLLAFSSGCQVRTAFFFSSYFFDITVFSLFKKEIPSEYK